MLLFLCFMAAHTVTPTKVKPVTIGERFVVTSKIMGEARECFVALPRGYHARQKAYPVLYTTDGEDNFYHTASAVSFLAGLGRMPDMIVIAVGNTQRTRDLTPPPNPGREDCCGADRFLDFFEKELMPAVEKRYRTKPYRIFSGHSYGGLFAVHCFLARTQLFGGYLAVSPTLFWADNDPVKRLEQFLGKTSSLSAALVVAQGTEHPRMVPPYQAFTKLLDGHKVENLLVAHRQFNEEDHGSVVYPATYWGLQQLFSFWAVPADVATKGLTEHLVYYQKVSSRMGYAVTLPEGACNNLGYRFLEEGRHDEAIAVFEWNTGHYPNSANTFDSLGEAYESKGQYKKALAQYEQAVKLARRQGEESGLFQSNADRVRTK